MAGRKSRAKGVLADSLQCTICDEFKPDDDFPRMKAFSFRRGRDYRCKMCRKERRSSPDYLAAQRISDRRRRLRQLGTSEVEVTNVWAEQGRCCKACRKPLELWASNFTVDHDHATGKFRGVLCSVCNTTLGLYNEDVDTLMSLIGYIIENTAETTTKPVHATYHTRSD